MRALCDLARDCIKWEVAGGGSVRDELTRRRRARSSRLGGRAEVRTSNDVDQKLLSKLRLMALARSLVW